ncbi:hypothetical protein SMC26_17530 [Actinomadura fulvescens]|uniref:hypothetical protein n=1 Tax=Actinomadura fulvescens TaxID=46160 RepID=UPI0031D55D1F
MITPSGRSAAAELILVVTAALLLEYRARTATATAPSRPGGGSTPGHLGQSEV